MGGEHCENPRALFDSQPQIAAISGAKGRACSRKRAERSGRERAVSVCLCVGEKEREQRKIKIPDSGTAFFRSGCVFAAVRSLS